MTRHIGKWLRRASFLLADDPERKTSREPDGWTQAGVLAAMREDPVASAVVHKLAAWAARRQLRVTGATTEVPALAWHLDLRGIDYTLFIADSRRARSQGSVLWLYLRHLLKKPLFTASLQDVLVKALSTHFEIPPDRVGKQPSIPLAALEDAEAFRVFTSAWDAVIDDMRRADTNWWW